MPLRQVPLCCVVPAGDPLASRQTVDEETQERHSLWVGKAEFSQDKMTLDDPYRNLLTDVDGPLVFVRQPDGAQNREEEGP